MHRFNQQGRGADLGKWIGKKFEAKSFKEHKEDDLDTGR